ncbi:sure-like protein [Cadophora sp. DSE1049]|nr:sure-like protein [Cadophora sp. DSE1049]
MHILIVNDDGPPAVPASHYVRNLVLALQAQKHTVSVVLHHRQRSYIGKAHLVDQDITITSYYPDHALSLVGLYHHFQDRGPVDLVVSGPNYGRNTTAVFRLGSGTIGGALEAAACGKKAVAISFGFDDYSLGANNAIIDAASKRCVELIARLVRDWGPNVHLFNINVPLTTKVHSAKAMYTKITQNGWTSRSCLQEIEACSNEQAGEPIFDSSQEGSTTPSFAGDTSSVAQGQAKKKILRFVAVPEGVSAPGEMPEGQDSWTADEGMISVTPLRANFMHVDKLRGEVEL